jgi:integrase
MTINEVVEKWLPNKRLFVKESSMSTYCNTVYNYILPHIGEMEPEEITNNVMQEFILELINDGLSRKSAQDSYIVLKMILNYSTEQFDTKYVKFRVKFPINSVSKQELEVYTEAEQKKIINYIIDNLTYEKLGILICLCTGIRIGEVCALQWGNVDIPNKCIHIQSTMQRIYQYDFEQEKQGKTKIIFSLPKTTQSYRDVPISKDLFQILKDYKRISKDTHYVTTGTTKFCEPRTYRNYYKRLIVDEIKLGRCIKFHGLRHSFATRMVANGVDVKTLGMILGHADVSTTMNLYVHPTMGSKLDAVNKSLRNLFK